MSCGSSALQSVLYDTLSADAALTALIGSAIFDAVPPGEAPETYVVLGDEVITDRSAVLCTAMRHDLTISVISTALGYGAAKAVAARVVEVLTGSELTLADGHLVYLNFLRARAARVGTASRRRIDVTFRAMVELV